MQKEGEGKRGTHACLVAKTRSRVFEIAFLLVVPIEEGIFFTQKLKWNRGMRSGSVSTGAVVYGLERGFCSFVLSFWDSVILNYDIRYL
jgi:hypothetical protein